MWDASSAVERAAIGSATVREKADLAGLVLERGTVRLDEPIELASGAFSKDFVDAKRALANGPDLVRACRAVIELVSGRDVQFDSVGGMTMGADMFAHVIAALTGTSWFVVRKQPKERGTRRQIEGEHLTPSHRVLLVEDTVTTGGSCLDALDVVQATGATVVMATALVDRGDSASGRFSTRGVPYEPILRYEDLGIDPVVPPR